MYNYAALQKDTFTYKPTNNIDLSGCVLFVEDENQVEIVKYLKDNYYKVKEYFKLRNKNFILLSEIDLNTNVSSQLAYLYPRLNTNFSTKKLTLSSVKTHVGYHGNIKTGLLSIESNGEFVQFKSNNLDDFKEFIKDFLNSVYVGFSNYMPPVQSEEDDEMISSENFESFTDDKIKLDEETKNTVNSILEQLETLKDKGSLLQVLPIVESYLETQNRDSISELSTINIDENFTVLLTDYNLEIKLSHLTKSIYLLFLNHPEGILLSELEVYRKELLEHYKSVSNRDDFDKMLLSVDDIIDTKTNAIYVHLSRIKSAFTKVVHPSIAEHYFIDGGKSKPKKIKINEGLIHWCKRKENASEPPLSKEAIIAIEKAKALLFKLGIK